MKNLIQKPYLIFLSIIPVTLFIGIIYGDDTLDINVHDTYFVISYYHIFELTSIFLGVLSFGYWIIHITNRKLIRWLTKAHIIITIGGLLLMYLISLIPCYDYSNSSSPMFDDLLDPNLLLTSILLIIILGQFFYFINIIIGVFRKK